MEEAWISFHLYDWTNHFFRVRVICVKSIRFLIGTSKDNQVFMPADGYSLRVEFHSLY